MLVHWCFASLIWARAVRNKLLMLLAPFLRRWNYTRVLEQVSGNMNCSILLLCMKLSGFIHGTWLKVFVRTPCRSQAATSIFLHDRM